jgi:hypothetical protein
MYGLTLVPFKRLQERVSASNRITAPTRSEAFMAQPPTMVMEMSAALAEWVSAPTLMKSTPVSA